MSSECAMAFQGRRLLPAIALVGILASIPASAAPRTWTDGHRQLFGQCRTGIARCTQRRVEEGQRRVDSPCRCQNSAPPTVAFLRS